MIISGPSVVYHTTGNITMGIEIKMLGKVVLD